MRHFHPIPAFRFLLFGSLALVAISSPLHAQDLRRWMPNVGDKFIYDEAYSYSSQSGGPEYTDNGRDTFMMEILQNDSLFISDTTWHVVVVKDTYYGAIQSSQQMFYFHVGRDSNSSHSLMIDAYEPSPNRADFAYDFSDSRDSQAEYGSKQITAYRFDSSIKVLGLVQTGEHHEVAVYSPELRWFLYRADYSSFYPNFNVWSDDASTMTLLSANVSRVEDSSPIASEFLVQYQGTSLQILLHTLKPLALVLFDPLGRPTRSLQMPGGAGERQITLNVADVPSGVYFLRVSAAGMEEMRKVAIAH